MAGAGAAGRQLGGGRGGPLRQRPGVGPVGHAGQVELAPLPHPLPPLDLWYAPPSLFFNTFYLILINSNILLIFMFIWFVAVPCDSAFLRRDLSRLTLTPAQRRSLNKARDHQLPPPPPPARG